MQPNRKTRMDELLFEIKGISDKEYQRRVWIRGEGPEVDDFDEAVIRYSHAADMFFKEYKECDVSDMQFNLIMQFHTQFKKFWQDNDLPQMFIDTPQWTKITNLAKNVLKSFGNTHKHRIVSRKLGKLKELIRSKMDAIQGAR